MNYYSPEAEQAVLGGLLRDNTTWPIIQEQLSFKDFYRREHQVLFDIISKKLEQGECVDALSLGNEAKTIPELKGINGEIYVLELLNQTYSTSNIASHASIVKSHSQRRKFKEILDYLDKHANEGDVKKLIQQAQIELSHLEPEKITQEHGILYQRFSDVEQQSINWLWPGRIARGKVTIIAGNPGLGKSQITSSLAAIVTTGDVWPVDKMLCQSGDVIFLSAEDDPCDTLAPRLSNENKLLQEKLKSYEVPENYSLPDVSLAEFVLNDLQHLAKSAGLNQEQFNKTLVSMQEQQQHYQTQLEERKKQLGNQLKVVEDYVTKNYPSSLHNTVLNTILGDENTMSDAMKHRDQVLNSQVPGLSNQRANLSDPYEGRTELLNIAKEYQKNPTEKNRKRYINLAQEVAEARVKV